MSEAQSHEYRHSGCRYCQRYERACGRVHTETTRADWGRDWAGNSAEAVSNARRAQTELLRRHTAALRDQRANEIHIVDPKA